MVDRVLILAAGEGKRWQNFRNTSKHRIIIENQSLVDRQIRQFSDFRCEIVVVSNERNDTFSGANLYIPRSESTWLDMAKFYSSMEMWSDNRTFLVFGDVFFTDEAVQKMMVAKDEILFFLRKGESLITGKQYKEIFAIAFEVKMVPQVRFWLESVIQEGCAKAAGGWFLYKKFLQEQGLELSEGLEQGIAYVSIDDWTEDFDYPIDLLVWEKKRQGINDRLEILEEIVREVPRYWTSQHMLQYEYYKAERWNETLQTGSRALSIPCDWNIERAATCMWNAEAAFELGYTDWALEWAERGVNAAPIFFEAKGVFANISYKLEDWLSCYKYAIQILTHDRLSSDLTRDHYWDWFIYDLIAFASYKLGKKDEALHFGNLACNGNPLDMRLQQNLHFYQSM
jgi:tetratricopeptide (TPR) repeat protein